MEINFRYSLVAIDNNASGTYTIEIIYFGYLVKEGSGDTCVWDISAWLNQLTSSSSMVQINQFRGYRFFCAFLYL
ncbi:MAG: hypothetical protein ACFFCU_20095 [Promethearchaeota archaeon]